MNLYSKVITAAFVAYVEQEGATPCGYEEVKEFFEQLFGTLNENEFNEAMRIFEKFYKIYNYLDRKDL